MVPRKIAHSKQSRCAHVMWNLRAASADEMLFPAYSRAAYSLPKEKVIQDVMRS